MAVLANNLANVNTPGFKADQLNFSAVLDEATGTTTVGAGQYVEFTPGSVETTGNPLDVAIDGDGFFMVDTPDGPRYTRNGSFHLGADGMLVTPEGYPVMGAGGPVAINPDTANVTISPSGEVFEDGTQVNTLSVVTFPAGVTPTKVGASLFKATGEIPAEQIRVTQGALERSNVEAVVEMTRMIEISRGYEAYQKLIQAMDQVASQTNSVV